MALLTVNGIKLDPEVETYIRVGNEHLGTMGFTEHGYRHVTLVSNISRNILIHLNYSAREQELAAIAGYLHDIGNTVSRINHAQIGALLARDILARMGMVPEEIAVIIAAIGNHDEEEGQPVNPISAALILADKSDVHRSRVRDTDFATFDIHDRVNFAVEHSFLRVEEESRNITLELTIDVNICPVIDYFEIFLTRMLMCRRAADFLKCHFHLEINSAKLL